jgi:hypothetical protein
MPCFRLVTPPSSICQPWLAVYHPHTQMDFGAYEHPIEDNGELRHHFSVCGMLHIIAKDLLRCNVGFKCEQQALHERMV